MSLTRAESTAALPGRANNRAARFVIAMMAKIGPTRFWRCDQSPDPTPTPQSYSKKRACTLRRRLLYIDFTTGVQVIEVHDRVEHQGIRSECLTAIDGVVGEQDDMSLLNRHIDDYRALRDVAAAVEQA
jgi:hypothetical protein